MFQILEGILLDEPVKNILRELERRHRLLKPFTVLGSQKNEKCGYQIGIYIIDEERNFWGGFRQQIESQLINAGVCAPAFTTQQELKWKELKQIISQFINPLEVQQAIYQDCRNALLHGWVDNIESKLPLTTYLRCKKIITDLGKDTFAEDYEWYFGNSIPEDSHKGLEE